MRNSSFCLLSSIPIVILSILVLPVFGVSAPPDGDGDEIPNLDDFSAPFDARSGLSINGTTFYDRNGNGFMDADESGLSGWMIRLIQDGNEIANIVSDNQGGYSFSDLAPGRYVVLEDLQPEWNQTAPGGGWYEVTLTDKDGQRYDFGNYNGSVDQIRLLTEFELPLMRPSPEELRRWIEEYEAAPAAPLDPEITARLATEPLVVTHFSLLDHLRYTPSERVQGHCGDCWAWAGTGVMEIALDVQRGVKDRLSVQYLNSNFDSGSGSDWACCGGWLSDVANFYSASDKAIPWTNANAHWQDGGRWCWDQLTSVPCSAISTNPSYPITSIEDQSISTFGDEVTQVTQEEAISNIKNVLNQNKAVWFAFFLPTDVEWNGFRSFWSTQPETAIWDPPQLSGKTMISGEYAGHAVLCVGYDDTDDNNRYWIMLNSWGAPSNRPNGLFRVSMDMDYDDYISYEGDDYPAFHWETLELDYSEDVGTDPGTTKTLMAAGSTTPGATNWQAHDSRTIYVDVDTSAAGFAETPLYFTSLSGTYNLKDVGGICSLYSPTATGFRIYLIKLDGSTLLPEYANNRHWSVQWLGVLQTYNNVGCTPKGATNWQAHDSRTIYVDVDTSAAGFTETPLYFTSLSGTYNLKDVGGICSLYSPTATGFRIYLIKLDGTTLLPEYANDRHWSVQWLGVLQTDNNAGCTLRGATNWQAHDSRTIYVDVDTSAAGFIETPLYFTSLSGTYNLKDVGGICSLYSPTTTGFRIYLVKLDGSTLSPEYANNRNWSAQWLGVI